jgi:hypothetical protein
MKKTRDRKPRETVSLKNIKIKIFTVQYNMDFTGIKRRRIICRSGFAALPCCNCFLRNGHYSKWDDFGTVTKTRLENMKKLQIGVKTIFAYYI